VLRNALPPLLSIPNIHELMDIKVFFYGYAYEFLRNDSLLYDHHCHHGEEECQLAYHMNCASSIFGQELGLNFNICMENSIADGKALNKTMVEAVYSDKI